MLERKSVLCGLIVASAFMATASCFAEDSMMPSDKLLTQFSAYAEEVRVDWQVPGMAIAIVKDNKIIYAKGFGVRNAKGENVSPETIFDIASLSKSFTAALLAKQIDEGKYNWNTKVQALYPEFKLYDPKSTQEFEVQDLLAHDSGLPEDALAVVSGNFGYDIDHVFYALRFIKPVAPFRTQFAYQDIFPLLAGKIIQQSSNENFSAALHQQLLKPLQMNHSYLDSEEKLYQLTNVAQAFALVSGRVYPYPMHSVYLSKIIASQKGIGGNGGIHSSAIDMAKWLIFNINKGVVENTQLISVKNMNYMHSPLSLIKASTPNVNLNGESEQAYGQGWFIDKEKYAPYTVLYHPGGGTGMHALMAYIPEKNIGIVILTNTWGNMVPEALFQRFFDLYLGEKSLKNWSELYLKKNTQATAHEALSVRVSQCQAMQAVALKNYAGRYSNPVYGDLMMTKQGDHLSLQIGPIGIVWKLSACQKNLLKAYWPNPYGMDIAMLGEGDDLVEFKVDSSGAVKSMTIPFLNGDGSGVFVKNPLST